MLTKWKKHTKYLIDLILWIMTCNTKLMSLDMKLKKLLVLIKKVLLMMITPVAEQIYLLF